MKWNMRRTAASGALTVAAMVAALLPGGAAQAGPDSGGAVKVDVSTRALAAAHPVSAAGAKFVTQGRAAGLTATQADALQVKVDKYLAAFGKGATQVGPDQITVKGSELFVAVPGEAHPRGLSSAIGAQLAISCPYTYFCAYSAQWFSGDAFLLENCNGGASIPWVSTGSWKNNQTPGTQPWLYFLPGQGDPWHMPGAYAEASAGVGWWPVDFIDPC
jgi:hypothetical protein